MASISLYNELLQNINQLIRDDLFPLIGIPRETYGSRIRDIPNNLMEIRDELRKLLRNSEKQSRKLEKIISKTQNTLQDIKDDYPPEMLENISELFKE